MTIFGKQRITMSKHDKLSVFISLILRHSPQTIHMTLDEFGYANVDELIQGINNSGRYIDLDILQEIVDKDKKKRYSFDDTKTLIRANQGHSVHVNVPLRTVTPPTYLFHGTATNSLQSILTQGIKKMNRLYVHLSDNTETAFQVGKRHGKVVILKIDTLKMHEDGYIFLVSENDVWLTEFIPVQYINNLSDLMEELL